MLHQGNQGREHVSHELMGTRTRSLGIRPELSRAWQSEGGEPSQFSTKSPYSDLAQAPDRALGTSPQHRK